MTQNNIPLFDRRGFAWALNLTLVLLPCSLLLFMVVSWPVALTTLLLLCITFITLEAVTRRPDNNPVAFVRFLRQKNDRRAPVLLCLGDSLTHGNLSGSVTPYIPFVLTQQLGLELANLGQTFAEPLYVVNAGQNNITSRVVLERLNICLNTHPDYVLLWIGTNDVQCMYGGLVAQYLLRANQLQETPPTLDSLQTNIQRIIRHIRTASPQVQIGVCTLPPLGENLQSKPNKLIQQANERIRNVVQNQKDDDKLTLIDVYGGLESVLEKNRSRFGFPFAWRFVSMLIVHPLYHVFFANWNLLSKPFGYTILNDGLHLNDRGRDIVVDLIVEWLCSRHVAKAIAVKR